MFSWKQEDGRLWHENEKGEVLAEITWREKDHVWTIEHTFVDPSLRGGGVAGALMKEVALRAKAKHKKLVGECSYAVAWLKKNPQEY